MAAGERKERITFLAQKPGQDAYGQPNGAWLPVPCGTVWAKSAGVSSRDIAAAGGNQSILDAKFIVKYRAAVPPTWRVQWRGQQYEIVGRPAPVSGGAEWLEIRCSQTVVA